MGVDLALVGFHHVDDAQRAGTTGTTGSCC